MIIKRFELNRNKINEFEFFLLYGKNEGLQNEIIGLHLIKDFDGEIIRYDESEFLKSKEMIISELLNKSLFESKNFTDLGNGKILNSIYEIRKRCNGLENNTQKEFLKRNQNYETFLKKRVI